MFQSMQMLALLIERLNRIEKAVFADDGESVNRTPEEILLEKLFRLNGAMGPIFGNLTFNKDSKSFSSEMSMDQMSFLVGHLMDTLMLINESMKERSGNYLIARATTSHMQSIIDKIQDEDDSICVKTMLANGMETEVKALLASYMKSVRDQTNSDTIIDEFADLAVEHAMLMTHSNRIMSLTYDVVEVGMGSRERENEEKPVLVEKTRLSDKVTKIEFSSYRSRANAKLVQGQRK